MSFHEQNLEAFIELVTDKRSRRLFSQEDLVELGQIIDALPDDIEKMSIAIATWYENRPAIVDAQLDILNDLLSPPAISQQKTNPLALERVPGTQKAIVERIKPPIDKQTLHKAIQPRNSDRFS